jgi:hypothetical protein
MASESWGPAMRDTCDTYFGNNRSRVRACAYNGLILFSCHKCHGPRFPGVRLLLGGQTTGRAGMTGLGCTPLAGPPTDWGDTGEAGVRGSSRCKGANRASLRQDESETGLQRAFRDAKRPT